MKFKIENIVTPNSEPTTMKLPLRKLNFNQRMTVYEKVPARKVAKLRQELGYLIQQSKTTADRRKKFTVATLAHSKGLYNLCVECRAKRS